MIALIPWALITAAWAACMITASHLWTREGRATDARYATAAALTAWAWPAFLIITITWYLIYRKRIP